MNAGLVKYGRHTGQLVGGDLSRRQMVDREHGVGLATTEGGLQLNDRVAPLPGETLRDGNQQQAHALGDEGAGEELLGILIFW